MPICAKQWEKYFTSIKQVSRENKLREFHFKFLHRIVVTKKELCRFGIKDDSKCLYCGEQDSFFFNTRLRKNGACVLRVRRPLISDLYCKPLFHNLNNLIPVTRKGRCHLQVTSVCAHYARISGQPGGPNPGQPQGNLRTW